MRCVCGGGCGDNRASRPILIVRFYRDYTLDMDTRVPMAIVARLLRETANAAEGKTGRMVILEDRE